MDSTGSRNKNLSFTAKLSEPRNIISIFFLLVTAIYFAGYLAVTFSGASFGYSYVFQGNVSTVEDLKNIYFQAADSSSILDAKEFGLWVLFPSISVIFFLIVPSIGTRLNKTIVGIIIILIIFISAYAANQFDAKRRKGVASEFHLPGVVKLYTETKYPGVENYLYTHRIEKYGSKSFTFKTNGSKELVANFYLTKGFSLNETEAEKDNNIIHLSWDKVYKKYYPSGQSVDVYWDVIISSENGLTIVRVSTFD